MDQGAPGSPSETLPPIPGVAPFLRGQTFDHWSKSVSHMIIPCGGRPGICTVAMQEYWLRVVAAMANYIGQGRGIRILLSNHHTYPIETVTLSLPTQTAVSYADRDRTWVSQNGMNHESVGFYTYQVSFRLERVCESSGGTTENGF